METQRKPKRHRMRRAELQAMTLEQRLWLNVDKRGPDECWEWNGALSIGGYGQFTLNKQRYVPHRLAFTLYKGEIPSEPPIGGTRWSVCHTCDNRLCVNPAHLWLGTQSENMKDAVRKQRLIPPCFQPRTSLCKPPLAVRRSPVEVKSHA